MTESYKASLARYSPLKPKTSALSPAEKRIARYLLSSGKSAVRIADILGISRETVHHQMEAVLNRTGQDTMLQAALAILRSPELLREVFEV